MNKILRKLQFHTEGEIINESIYNVWGDAHRTYICKHCSQWQIRTLSSNDLSAELNYKIAKKLQLR